VHLDPIHHDISVGSYPPAVRVLEYYFTENRNRTTSERQSVVLPRVELAWDQDYYNKVYTRGMVYISGMCIMCSMRLHLRYRCMHSCSTHAVLYAHCAHTVRPLYSHTVLSHLRNVCSHGVQ
jgi:hypothetical protein